MAAPSAFGTGVLQAPAPEPSVHVFNSTATRFTGVPIDTSNATVASLLVDQPADYNVPGPQFSIPDNTRLDWTGSSALVAVAAERGRASLLRPRAVEKNIAAEIAISAPKEVTGLTFDVGVAPRIAVREEGDILTRRVGGEVRIGQNFDLMSKGSGQPKGWYIFAGADGEALVWDADESGFRPSLGDMALTDQVTVGDLQAGFAVQRAGGELSLSYIRREMKYSDRNISISETEDFAGVSFTMRR